MDKNDMDELIRDSTRLVQDITQSSVMLDILKAYDTYAITAMAALLREKPGHSEDAIATSAWRLADFMMAERKKRGIGGM